MSIKGTMEVIKRDGRRERIMLDKITNRISSLWRKEPQLNQLVDPVKVAIKVVEGLYDGVTTVDLDILAAETAATMATIHPDYAKLAARIAVSNLHKETKPLFSDVICDLYEYINPKTNTHAPLISDELYNLVIANKERINEWIDYNKDYDYDYFGFKTLEKSYLLKLNGRVAERPQHMLMRVALGIHSADFESAKRTYDLMSDKYFTHATPTLFNSGTPNPQMSSCFLLDMNDDSITGIYKTLADCAKISQYAGGIGLTTHKIRATGSYIAGTNGTSNGIVPMLRVYNNTARYVDQCITEDTLIYTTEGPMKICNVVANKTLVYNTKGIPEIIKEVLEHPYNGSILHITTSNALFDLKITGEHPVFALQNQKKTLNFNTIQNRLQKNIIKPEWVDAKDLTIDSMIGYKIPVFSVDETKLTEDDCYFYGLILGDGCLEKGKSYGHITMNTETKTQQLAFICNYLDAKFIHYTKYVEEDRLVTRIRWTKSVNNPIKYSDVYDATHTKHIQTKWLNLPLHKSKYIIKGLLQSDGTNGKELMFDNTSLNLIEGIRFLLIRMGVLTSGYVRDRVGETHISKYGSQITTQKLAYVLRIPKTSELCDLCGYSNPNKFFKFFRYKDYLFARIKQIKQVNFCGTLYDLEMPHTHNYMLHNGLVHNGGGRRKGSFAMYLEPWHADIFEFLDLKKNTGSEEHRARDLFYALWIPDLFMKRVKENGTWSLMCPNECKGLYEVYGNQFEELYLQYEQDESKVRKVVKAQDLWLKIIHSQIETGTPYMLYKDACNMKSNQQNLGTIKSSNLCAEICEYTDKDEIAVCNLASICLPKFVKDGVFDHDMLYNIVKQAVYNLNKVIDRNFYPLPETRRSNMRHRPVGLGMQGLADVFALMRLPFASESAKRLNREIAETMYFAALTASHELVLKEEAYGPEGSSVGPAGPYETFEGSPLSMGMFQFDLWEGRTQLSDRWDWEGLRSKIMRDGVRNSLLIALMPTASTAQIMGNNDAFEPFTSNLYTRRVLSGEFIVVNKYLLNDLTELGLWNADMKEQLMHDNGSVQNLDIPDELKEIYKTVWEVSMKDVIDMAADRGRFVDQSQSMNLFLESPQIDRVSKMHMYAWSKGLKTGMYYLRTKSAMNAVKVTVAPSVSKKTRRSRPDCDDTCLTCSA